MGNNTFLNIAAVYRAPNENLSVVHKLVEITRSPGLLSGNLIIGGDLNLPGISWQGVVDARSYCQSLVNELVWDNGLAQVVDVPTRAGAVLDVFLVQPEQMLIAHETIPGISDHEGVLLQVTWQGTRCTKNTIQLLFQYSRADTKGFQEYLIENYGVWESHGRNVNSL